VFFCSASTLIQSGTLFVVKPLKGVFYFLKGRGPLKKSKKIVGNVEEVKAYRMIPLTPTPLFFHFTVPLILKIGT
jgi:hypothetical protein